MWALLATGFLSVLGQVVLLRELAVAAFGVELVYLIGLGGWMLGSAAGALADRRRRPPRDAGVRWLLIAAGALVPCAVVFVRAGRTAFDAVPGAFLPLTTQLALAALALVPPAAALGLLFQWSARLAIARGGTLAFAYGVESLGGMAGGLVSTAALVWGLQNWGQSLVVTLAAASAVLLMSRRPSRGPTLAAVTGLAVVAAGFLTAQPVDRAMTRWNHPGLIDTIDTAYGRTTVTQIDGQVSIFENDALMAETEGTGAEIFAHLAALQHQAPGSILLLGGAAEGLAVFLAAHRPARMDLVEIDRVELLRIEALLPAATRASLAGPGVTIVFGDPRALLASPGRYDLVLVSAPEPTSGQSNRYYTREFFAACAHRLAPGGIVAFRVSGAENVWTPLVLARLASIRAALEGTFEDIVILPGTTSLVFASNRRLPRDPAVLIERFERRGLSGRLVGAPYIRYLYTNDRTSDLEARLAATRARPNSDNRPICYQLTSLSWLSTFIPAFARTDPDRIERWVWASLPWLAPVAVGLLTASAVIFRKRPAARRLLLVLVAGLAGMVIETVLLLHYQSAHGVLFQDLGMLLTGFMVGLAAGALCVDRWRRRQRPVDSCRLQMALAVGGLVAASAAVAALTAWGVWLSLAAAAAALVATGALVAAVFALASSMGRPGEVLPGFGALYAADLAGGAIGALAGSLVLVPAFGLPAAALAMAALAAMTLVLV